MVAELVYDNSHFHGKAVDSGGCGGAVAADRYAGGRGEEKKSGGAG